MFQFPLYLQNKNNIQSMLLEILCFNLLMFKKIRKKDISNVLQGPMLQSTMKLNNKNINITKVMQDSMLQSFLCLNTKSNKHNQ